MLALFLLTVSYAFFGATAMKWFGAFVGAGLLAAGFVTSASADQIICSDPSSCVFNLDQFVGTGTPPPGPWGTVTLTQVGTSISVNVSLNSNVFFAQTGAGESLLWDFSGDPNIASQVHLTGTSIGNFTFDSNPCGGGHTCDGSGFWNYGFICTGCGNGGSPPHVNSLTFTIDNTLLSAFIQNTSGFNLASDLCIGLDRDDQCIVTGDAVAHLGQIAVPEPESLVLLGSGLLAAGFLRRRKQKKAG